MRMRSALESAVIPLGALALSLALFGAFCAGAGASPAGVFGSIYTAGFGSWYSLQNSLLRAAPLMLCALCTALPARAGLINVGNEGAFVVGAIGATAAGLQTTNMTPTLCLLVMGVAGAVCGGVWIALAAALQHYRGVNSIISSLLLNYVALALLLHLIEGVMRDPSSLNAPASYALPETHLLGKIGGTRVHIGFVFGVVACVLGWLWIERSSHGMSVRVTGGNPRAAALVGIPIGRILLVTAFGGGAAAGLAGMVEVAGVHGRAALAVSAGYGYVGILVAFLARHRPLRVIFLSILIGAILASGGILQRLHNLPDATVTVLQGIVFLVILASETAYGRFGVFQEAPRG